MIKTEFELNIMNQYWMEPAEYDLCSHGEIYLKVNDTIITEPGVNESWGISESALALLRTLDENIQSNPVDGDGLILHGCGLELMVSCPISIHWSVSHCNGEVRLSQFAKVETTNPETSTQEYTGLEVILSLIDYKNRVLAFAKDAKDLFDKSPVKKFGEEYDRQMYERFWTEFNNRLKKFST